MSSSSRSSNIFDKYVSVIEADQRQKEAGYSRRKPGPTATRPPSKQLNIRRFMRSCLVTHISIARLCVR